MSIQGIYNRMWLVAATAESTTERVSGHTYPGSSTETSHHITVTSETNSGLFDWWGQYLDWFFNTKVPLPIQYNITWFDALLFCVALYFLGWFLGNILMGDD